MNAIYGLTEMASAYTIREADNKWRVLAIDPWTNEIDEGIDVDGGDDLFDTELEAKEWIRDMLNDMRGVYWNGKRSE